MTRERIGLLLPILAAAVLVAVLDPRLIFDGTTPTGGDLGGHVYPYALGVENVLSTGRLRGWSPGWFAGFPLFYFYFPLPAYLMAVLAPLTSFAVALKLVVVAGLVLLPLCSYALARAMGFAALESGCAGALGGAFAFMESYWHLGGNLYSTLVGEFSFSLSFALSLLFVALATRAVHRPGRGPVAALLLAGAALTHVLTTVAAVLASTPLLFRTDGRRWVLTTWAVGFALAGFWAIPFLVRSPYMGHVPWVPEISWSAFLPLELWFVVPGAAVGLWLLARKGRTAAPFFTLLAAAVLVFLVPSGLEMRDRLLPYWYFGLHFSAGIALGSGLVSFLDRRSRRGLAVVVTIGALVTTLFALRDAGGARDFAAWSLEGYEAKAAWPEYRTFVDAVAALPPGRLVWENDSTVARFGSLYAPALLPHWSPDHTTLYGLLVESSPTAPFARRILREMAADPPVAGFRGGAEPVPYDFDAGLAHLRLFGVRYFAAFTERGTLAAQSRLQLRPVAEGTGFAVFELEGVERVTVARHVPVVVEGPEYAAAARDWFRRADRLDEWIAAEGPGDWPRATGDPASWTPAPAISSSGSVSRIEDDGRRLSFSTTAVGVPHLVRVSHFPNWRVEGASGPYLAAPSLMLVVPTQERVTLVFRDTWVEWVGRGVTGLAVLALLVGRVLARRTRLDRPGA